MTSVSLKEAKNQLRKQIKRTLKGISRESLIIQSHDIHQKLLQLDRFQQCKKIAIFMNMPDSEVKTMDIIKSCYQHGKDVYLPRCNPFEVEGRKKNFLSMLQVPTFNDVLNLQPQGKYQLLEPILGIDAIEQGDLDVIIMPGVAFTKTKKRIGHGAGFYDEFLNYYFKKFQRKPYLIGIALQEQLVDDIPTEEHDFPLDKLIVANHDVY